MKERGRDGLQQAVTDLARVLKLDFYHPHDSRKSDPGYPDCTIIVRSVRHERRLIYAELKTQKARPTHHQARWLDSLSLVADESDGLVDVFLWRPSHWSDGWIEKILRGYDPDGEELGSGRWFYGAGVHLDKFSIPL